MGNLLEILLSATDRLFDKKSAPAQTQPPVSQTPKKSLRTSEEMLEVLNHSKVFSFEYIAGKGIVLTSCRKEYNIHSLTIPDVVDRIGSEAFMDCRFLQSITIPDSVKVIEKNAFKNCKYLEKVRFSEKLTRIGSNAFEECALTEAILPEGLWELGSRAFYNCEALRSVRLPDTLNSLANGVFYGCTSLEDIILPMSMNGSLYNAFAHCSSLKSFYIPEGITEIGSWTFEYCGALNDVYIPSSVKKIGSCAFLNCSSIEYIHIPDSVEEIDTSAVFSGCTSLKKIRLPIGIRFTHRFESDFNKLFAKCDALHTVVLGSHSFDVDVPPDGDTLLVFHAELAAAGNPTARRFVVGNLRDILFAIIERNDRQCADRLLSSGALTKDNVSGEDILKALDRAAEKGSNEIYVMLLQFRRDTLGFDTPEDRFRL